MILAYCSKTNPRRRACQWELTAAFLAAQVEGDPRRRVLVVSPEGNPTTSIPLSCVTQSSAPLPPATEQRFTNWCNQLSSMWP